MGLWDSVTGFFSDIGDFFSGKSFFELAGYLWNTLMESAGDILLKNPSKGDYAGIWSELGNIYTVLNVIATSLVVLFFLYGFLRDSVDIHSELTFDRTIKMFIRLILTANAVSFAFSWMPDFFTWAKNITEVILGTKTFGFSFDGAEIYDQIADADWGAMVAFLTSFLFFLFAAVCGFIVILTVLKRVVNIYLIAPFCAIALSTLAAGGQTSQVGYSYIRTFLGYVFSACLIAVVIVISGSFIDTFAITSQNAIVKLVECCVKMGAIATAVKGADSVMQKAFNL